MKRIAYILLCALLLGTAAVSAQGPAGKTAATVVADVLTRMPAQDVESFNAQMKELASTGEAGVLQLAGMMNPPGKGSNARVEYALSGLSHWVSTRGNEAGRLVVSNAYIKALAAATDREVKAFIIRELQLIGGNEAVDPLTALLADDSLKEPARAALASITGNAVPRVAPALAPAAFRTNALAGKMAVKPAKATSLLTKALNDGDRRYRFAALEMASPYADAAMYAAVVRSLAKAQPGVTTDVLNWLSEESDLPGRGEVIAPIAVDAAIGALATGDIDQTQAAAGLLTRIGGGKAIGALASLLGSADPDIVGVAVGALASTGGDIASAVAPFAGTGSEAGKVAALSLLAGRKSVKNAATVFGQLNAASPAVRTAAYAALKNVVSAADVAKLWPLLESASAENVAPVQQAITEAMHALPAAGQYTSVLDKMNAAPAAKQYLYYPVLASTGDGRALALITGRFDKESGTAGDAAFAALEGWQGIDAANKLLAVAKDPARSGYFDRAIDRVTILASDPAVDGELRRGLLVEALDLVKTDPLRRAVLTRIGTTNSYSGMVKAGEYLDHPTANVQQAAATAVMRIALANPQFMGVEVRGLLNKVIEVIDNPDADYQRQAMRKYLADMEELPVE